MDRKNTWIFGGAIVLGFLVFGLSQLWAQRFPGDGRGGGDGLVGRYQAVRSSPETVLLLDTVTGDLYVAGRDDIRPSSARHRGGEMGGNDSRMKDKRKDKDAGPFKDAKDVKRGDFKDKAESPFDRKDDKE
jgi:hypothetical protein